MNSARKPIMPLETAVILKIETEMIAKILPSSFSGMFFCIIDTLEILKKEFLCHAHMTKSLIVS